ncbi:twin-arginine translocase TatA/TatE family subunit [Microbacterium halophytorum]|uniref:twin-arginine translocase TatA/TatE family subunit n=1 Tax=Microbacterium halophytorum TaxID=2067568 RepID=UPI000CFD4266|nr:twin-arginine translocase TatA/TatE family subunit [Microbacterium halophytorum]
MGNMGIWQILLILLVILLIFGAARLPALAKSLGQSARAFKGEMKQMKSEDAADKATDAAPETTAQPTASEKDTGYTLNGEPVSRPSDSNQP